MSQAFHKKIIKPEVEEIDRDENLNNKGLAFQKWLVNLFCEHNQGIDEQDDARFLTTRDGGVDIMLFYPNKEIRVIQAKYVEAGPRRPIKREDVLGFKELRRQISDEWLDNSRNLSGEAKDAYGEYLRRLEDGWQATWLFITTGDIPENLKKSEDEQFKIYGTSHLNEIHKETSDQAKSIPPEVEFRIAGDKFFHFEEPRETLIAVVRGNELRNLYDKHHDSLLAYNVRKFMGSISINSAITQTAKHAGDNFLYFNNGISAICNEFAVTGNKVTAKKFQIINGGQTMGSIHKAGNQRNVEVLLKLCKGEGMTTDKGFNRDIVRFNNTQNAIKDSDFRANDRIQEHIQKRFGDLKAKGALSKRFDYRPKRGGRRASVGYKALKLEELGKIRYAYKHDPCCSIESPKLLWDIDEKYKDAFGGKDDVWSDEDFNEAVLALVLFDWIQNTIKKVNKDQEDEDLRINPRLRYHILGLAHIYFDHNDLPVKIWEDGKKFEDAFGKFWNSQIDSILGFQESVKGQNVARGALSNLLRNPTKWEELAKKYKRRLNAAY